MADTAGIADAAVEAEAAGTAGAAAEGLQMWP